MSLTEETVRAEDLNNGDIVRVTFEAPFRDIDGDGDLWFVGDGRGRMIDGRLPFTITRLPKPLEVGDRVLVPVSSIRGVRGRILAIRDSDAWVHFDTGGYTTASLSSLTRIEQEPG